MTRLRAEATPIAEVEVISRWRVADQRGFLERLFESNDLGPILRGRTIQQVNRTFTKVAGTVRGLHTQLPPNQEAKIISCTKGRVFDVAVDLRRHSPTFLQWFGCELSERNEKSLLVPPGCAHGVQTLEADCELLYLHTAPFAPESEAGLNPLSASIGIAWPLSVSHLSERDQNETSDPILFKGVNW